jgi:methyl-accepting chemotaxis protein
MEQVTQKAASSAEESAAAGEELNAQAETMRNVVSEIHAMVE